MMKNRNGRRNFRHEQLGGKSIYETAQELGCSHANVVQLTNRAMMKIAWALMEGLRPGEATEEEVYNLSTNIDLVELVIQALKEKDRNKRLQNLN